MKERNCSLSKHDDCASVAGVRAPASKGQMTERHCTYGLAEMI